MSAIRTLLLAATACAALLAQAQPVVHWLETEHDFGIFHEEDGKVSCTMRLVNTGDSALVITQVRTSCGCTASDYDKRPIAPGDTTSVRVTYDPVARPGKFVKNVFVYTNGNPRRSSLEIRGKVIAQPETLAVFYPVAAGDLRMGNAIIPLGSLTRGQKRSSYTAVLNASSTDTLLISVNGSTTLLKGAATPDTLPPSEVGAVTVFMDTRADGTLWGLNADTLTVSARPLHGQGEPSVIPLVVTAQVLDDFKSLTDKQRSQAPVITLSTDKLMFTPETTTTTFTITNDGKQPLELRRLWTAEPGVSIVCDKIRLKHGKKATATVTIAPAQLRQSLLNGQMTIVSNDPAHQSITIRLVGQF